MLRICLQQSWLISVVWAAHAARIVVEAFCRSVVCDFHGTHGICELCEQGFYGFKTLTRVTIRVIVSCA